MLESNNIVQAEDTDAAVAPKKAEVIRPEDVRATALKLTGVNVPDDQIHNLVAPGMSFGDSIKALRSAGRTSITIASLYANERSLPAPGPGQIILFKPGVPVKGRPTFETAQLWSAAKPMRPANRPSTTTRLNGPQTASASAEPDPTELAAKVSARIAAAAATAERTNQPERISQRGGAGAYGATIRPAWKRR